MKASIHFVTAIPLSAIGYYMTDNNAAYSALIFCGQFLIDIDHFFDYFYMHGFKKIDWRLRHFFKSCDETNFKKIMLFFHSYEIAIILLTLFIIYKPYYLGAFLIGFIPHLLMDTIGNPMKSRFTYFLIYRITKKFEFTELFEFSKNHTVI